MEDAVQIDRWTRGDCIETMFSGLHAEILVLMPGLARIAFAVYDKKSDELKTLVCSSEQGNPLPHYVARLANVASLAELAAERRCRILDDLSALPTTSTHSRKLHDAGYRSSYTSPIFQGDELLGFLFFDSCEKSYFTRVHQQQLAVVSHMLGIAILNALKPAEILKSAVGLVGALGRLRDEETGGHLQRMSRYARIIAACMARDRGLSEEFVEFVFLFAPLHDIGKIAIPDAILLKAGPLDPAEFEVMKRHPALGAEIVDGICRHFAIADQSHVALLRNIVLHHHESYDGSGYGQGLAGEDIPLEARIVAVADVYDALTSVRPYKKAWEPDQAVAWMQRNAGLKLDPDCVSAFCSMRGEIEAVRLKFQAEQDDEEECLLNSFSVL